MKQKTVKSAQKRISKTGRNKLLRRKMSAQHLSAGKSKRIRSDASKTIAVSKADRKRIKRLIPNK
ncbi:MAG: 50S ribosomal protein L35 [Patescibacteria group bacterium]|jgi:ribosomal protein L35